MKFVGCEEKEVELPGGFRNSDGKVVKEAVIREMVGHDEEAIKIDKNTNGGQVITQVLFKTVVSLGGSEKFTVEDIQSLLMGDRDWLFYAVRQLSFDEKIPVFGKCGHCETLFRDEIEYTKLPQVKWKKFKDGLTYTLSVPVINPEDGSEHKTVEMAFPNGYVQESMGGIGVLTLGATNDIMLRGCIRKIGNIVLATDVIKGLRTRDRLNMTRMILEESPGPKISTMVSCTKCKSPVLLSFSPPTEGFFSQP